MGYFAFMVLLNSRVLMPSSLLQKSNQAPHPSPFPNPSASGVGPDARAECDYIKKLKRATVTASSKARHVKSTH